MTMKCPECRAPLNSTDGEKAYCSPQCGKQYQILFSREWETAKAKQPTPPPPKPVNQELAAGKIKTECPHCNKGFTVNREALGKTATCPKCSEKFEIKEAAVAAKCKSHPTVDAVYSCAMCGAPICEICSFPQPNGSRKCPDCAAIAPGTGAGQAVSQGVKCVNHPDVQATVECKVCHSPICSTCDFALPGGVHVCPKCVEIQGRTLSKGRKKAVTWSYVTAIISTILFIVFFVLLAGVTTESEAEAIGMALGSIILISALIGTGLAFSALEKTAAQSDQYLGGRHLESFTGRQLSVVDHPWPVHGLMPHCYRMQVLEVQ